MNPHTDNALRNTNSTRQGRLRPAKSDRGIKSIHSSCIVSVHDPVIKHERVEYVNTNVFGFRDQIPSVDKTDLTTFGKRLAYARVLRGFKAQEDLAKAVGITQAAIGNFESGQRKKPRDIVRLAAALKVRPEWLEFGEGPMDFLDTKLRDDVFELARLIQHLSAQQMKLIRELVIALGHPNDGSPVGTPTIGSQIDDHENV